MSARQAPPVPGPEAGAAATRASAPRRTAWPEHASTSASIGARTPAREPLTVQASVLAVATGERVFGNARHAGRGALRDRIMWTSGGIPASANRCAMTSSSSPPAARSSRRWTLCARSTMRARHGTRTSPRDDLACSRRTRPYSCGPASVTAFRLHSRTPHVPLDHEPIGRLAGAAGGGVHGIPATRARRRCRARSGGEVRL